MSRAHQGMPPVTPEEDAKIQAAARAVLSRRNLGTTSLLFYMMAAQSIDRAEALREYPTTLRDGENHYAGPVTESVIMCVVCLEAAINEIVHWLETHPVKPLAFPDRFTELQLETKWFLLPVVAGVRRFDKGARPWQDFHHLVAIRNALVHAKVGQKPTASIAWLAQRDALLPVDDWLFSLLSINTAKWAKATLIAMLQDLSESISESWKIATYPAECPDHIWQWGALLVGEKKR